MRRILAFLAFFGLVAAGCGLAEDEIVLTADAAGEIVIDMDEFTFGTDRIEVTAGETVTFILVNAGDNEHEFMIGRNLQETQEGYPNGFEHDFFEDVTPIVDPPNAGMDMGAMGDMDMGTMDMSDDTMSDDEMDSMTDDSMSGDEMDSMTDDSMSDDEMDAMTDDSMSDDEMDAMTDDSMSDDEMDAMTDDSMSGDEMDSMTDDSMSGDEMDAMTDDTMSDGEMDGMDMGGGDAGEDVHAGFMVQRRPGEVARLTVTVPQDAVGEWDVGCFRGRGSHWDAGMRTTLVVRTA
jgi:hypothetical protein